MAKHFSNLDELAELISGPSHGVLETIKKYAGRIAVLGAGGKMGFHVCRMVQRALMATQCGGSVLAVSRFSDAEVRKRFERADITVHAADLCDDRQVEALPDVDAVFFLAGVKFGTASNTELLQRMNVEMPRSVAKRFCKARIVALSTGCVYEFVSPESGGSDETSSTNPPGAYAQSCLGRERAFVDASRTHGTHCTLIRLNYSNELRYGVLVDIGRRVLAREPVALDMGYVNVIWQGDAVDHIIQSLDRADTPPFVLNVTGPEILSVRYVATEFGKRFQEAPIFSGEESKTAWLNNASLSHQLFGPPRTSVDQMVDWIASWLAEGGFTMDKRTHFEVRDGDY